MHQNSAETFGHGWLRTIVLHQVADSDTENMLFDHNIQIPITFYKYYRNKIRNWSGNYY